MVGLDDIKSAVSANIVPIAVGTGVALVGTGVVIAAASRSKSKKKTRAGRKRDRKYISKQKHEQAYLRKHPKRRKTGKYYKTKSRKSKSKKGIHYTKKGQPYKIMANGRARFIKKTGRKK